MILLPPGLDLSIAIYTQKIHPADRVLQISDYASLALWPERSSREDYPVSSLPISFSPSTVKEFHLTDCSEVLISPDGIQLFLLLLLYF